MRPTTNSPKNELMHYKHTNIIQSLQYSYLYNSKFTVTTFKSHSSHFLNCLESFTRADFPKNVRFWPS